METNDQIQWIANPRPKFVWNGPIENDSGAIVFQIRKGAGK